MVQCGPEEMRAVVVIGVKVVQLMHVADVVLMIVVKVITVEATAAAE
jgi:hypothetical protein